MSLEATTTNTTTANTAAPPVAVVAECPDCAGVVPFSRPPLNGEIVVCEECGLELEVISRAPVRLEAAPEVEEDWGE